ncbi:triose-phosphate isomerase [Aestuariivita sp.]|uniref:triose-phosphate isomerase n=1 Tax=Aestuariivita sp. TaxID=1872407 RepID=UPI00217274C3|nr:triose-phosphate isomerase [Aestuariivita sp.]MCE8007911.1 triose-phosphate isomerase [Aestuariivita sp.]
MRRRLAAGNWKMHGGTTSLTEIHALTRAHPAPAVDILICPPATLIEQAARTASGSAVAIGGQDCHPAPSGAHTGDISAPMLKEAGATHVILGHSERRTDHGEHDTDVRKKAHAAQTTGLVAIICLGESLAQREEGSTLGVISAQMTGSIPDNPTAGKLVIAYEPIWAIGTGLTPTPAQIGEVHGHMRAALTARFGAELAQGVPLLYGGSVKPGNAAEIFRVADVDGALVGGASLTAEDFSPIISALEAS